VAVLFAWTLTLVIALNVLQGAIDFLESRFLAYRGE
jgi:hypothetical protein